MIIRENGAIIKFINLLLGTVAAVGFANSSDCALEHDMVISEESLLAEYSAIFSRPDQDNLSFILGSGDTLNISNSNFSLYELHTLCGYLPDVNYFTVNVFGLEYSYFLLINSNNGWRTNAISPPIQSPDRKRLLCAWSSPVHNDLYQNGIQIFRLDEDSLVMEFSGTFCDWYPERVRWVSNTEVAYSRSPLFSSESSSDSTLEGGTINLDIEDNWILKFPDHWSSAYRGGVQVF